VFQWTDGLSAAPDQLFGRLVYTDSGMPATAVSGTSIAFGDWSALKVRMTGLTFTRSDDYAFATDIVTFRATTRADGTLIDSNAIGVYKGGTA
jgi:HK97 family phage major capsid protein